MIATHLVEYKIGHSKKKNISQILTEKYGTIP